MRVFVKSLLILGSLTYLFNYLILYLPICLVTYLLTYLFTYLITYLVTYLFASLLAGLLACLEQSPSCEAAWFCGSPHIHTLLGPRKRIRMFTSAHHLSLF
jgi:hypothetical protein